MNLEQLRAAYQQMNVRFEDDFILKRAIIYYDVVTEVYKSFFDEETKKALNQIAPEGYEKVKPAFSSSHLLTGLCHLLDEPTVEVVNAAISRTSYGQYFEGLFKDYSASIQRLLPQDSTIYIVFKLIKEHFRDNILTACKRVLSDWDALGKMFVDREGQRLDQLTEITSTGSDFHKGGQQVLILSFNTEPDKKQLRIVYKPSDLEVDCLIMGDTRALEKAGLGDFQEESLMEILWLMKTPQDVPPYDFPRYKILPRNPGSRLERDGNGHLPIRTSYGYLEFLEYGDSQRQLSRENKDTLCKRFYTILGQLAAVACTFSLSDLHIENLIAHQYTPYLIDLENSLTRPIDQLSATEMTTGVIVNGGAIDGVLLEDVVPTVISDSAKQIDMSTYYRPGKNRLWTDKTALIGVAEYGQFLVEGFRNTMESIHLTYERKRFNDWFTRLKRGAIVRIVPLGSNQLHDILISTFSSQKRAEDVRPALEKKMMAELAAAYQTWKAAIDSNKTPISWETFPRFLCLQPQYVIDDLASYDVPVFYFQLSTGNVMDSHGRQIVISTTIDINKDAKPVGSLLKRATFFFTPPLDYIQTTQVKGNASPPQVDNLLKQLQDALKLDEVQQYDNRVSQGVVNWKQ